jgi:hypothetical protein
VKITSSECDGYKSDPLVRVTSTTTFCVWADDGKVTVEGTITSTNLPDAKNKMRVFEAFLKDAIKSFFKSTHEGKRETDNKP